MFGNTKSTSSSHVSDDKNKFLLEKKMARQKREWKAMEMNAVIKIQVTRFSIIDVGKLMFVKKHSLF